MPTALTILGVVLFALVILVSIALHEVGHLLPAKRFGVKVTQYMVGFGPTMWSRRRGETEYGVKWIPLGGYIRMIGMFPPKPGEDPRLLRGSSTGPFQAMVQDARRSSLEEVSPGDEARVFHALKARQKVVVMLGGPTVNLLLGVLLLGVAYSGIGAQQYVRTPTLGTVSECVLPAGSQRASCASSDPQAPAAAAGLRPGDVVTSYAGRRIGTWTQLQAAIRASEPGEAVSVGVLREGRSLTITATPAQTRRPVSATDPTLVTTAFLGVAPATERVTLPVSELPGRTWSALSGTAGAVLGIPARMVGIWNAAFGGGERELDGPIGVVGVSRIGGEVAAMDDPFYAKVSTFVLLAASLNLALFVFNLIPLLPLDGGHVAGALWEGVRRHLARLRRAPDPGPVDVARMLPVAYAVAVLLIGMSGLLLYADVVNPVRLGG